MEPQNPYNYAFERGEKVGHANVSVELTRNPQL
jgi:hypothetical protein